MTDPAYHLRPNKAADRLALIEAVRRLERLDGKGLKEYTYYGLGGPYLEDFRLIHESWPDICMVSIEENEETIKRQEFHRPFSSLVLVNTTLSSFITRYDSNNRKSIFWLDYTGLELNCFTDFQGVLEEVAYGSMIKITLRSNPNDFRTTDKSDLNNRGKKLLRDCEGLIYPKRDDLPSTWEDFANMLQQIIKIAARDVLPISNDKRFVPVSSFYYSDGTPMFTLTGIVCRTGEMDKLKKAFEGWELANLEWQPPMEIKMPSLSTKERLHLQPLLPTKNPEITLREGLDYLIDDNLEMTEKALKQYATFDRYEPYFLKGIP